MRNKTVAIIICLIITVYASQALAQEPVSYNVTWEPVTDPSVADVLIYRSTTGNVGDLTLIGTANPGDLLFNDAGLVKGVRYYYRLRNRNDSSVSSAYSAQVSALRLDPSSPETLKDLCRVISATSLDTTTYEISWVTSDPCITKLKYWRVGDENNKQITSLTSSYTTSHSVVLSDLETNESYMVRAISFDQSANMTSSVEFLFSTNTTTVVEFDLETSVDTLTIVEGTTGTFGVRLTADPLATIEVAVSHVDGDTDISVTAGAVLTFDSSNWDQYQQVTLSAAEDIDADSGVAGILVYVNSGQPGPMVTVRVFEDDNDTGDPQPPPPPIGVAVDEPADE